MTCVLGWGRNDPDAHALDVGTERGADAQPQIVRGIAQPGGEGSAGNADRQSAVIESCTHGGVGEFGWQRRTNGLQRQAAVGRPRFERAQPLSTYLQ